MQIFGLSTYDTDIKNKNTLFVGTRGYMSPEIASPMIDDYNDETDEPIFKEITPSCDIFSLAVILWQMLNGIESIPFDEATPNNAKYAFIAQNESKMFWKCHYNCRIVKNGSTDTQTLLIQMLTFNPDKRISIAEIRNSDWYTGVAGYNNDKTSQSYFQDSMKRMHYQLMKQQTAIIEQTQQTTMIPNLMPSINFNNNILSVASEQPSDCQTTQFNFSQLKYVPISVVCTDRKNFSDY